MNTNYKELSKIEDYLIHDLGLSLPSLEDSPRTIIEDYLIHDLGLSLSPLQVLPKTIENGLTKLDEPISIDPKDAGPFAPIFEPTELKISWKTDIYQDKRVTGLFLDYNYPSGSNGYSLTLISVDGSDWCVQR